jgi:hypothetical protein
MIPRALGFLIAAAWLLPATAFAAEPWGVRLGYSTPDATTTASLAWNTDTDDPTVVEYGTTTAYGMTVEGTSSARGADLRYVHEANLTGLKPDTVYHYRVGSPGGWSPDFTFRTAPADLCAPYSIVAMGDDRSDDDSGPSPRWNPILMESLSWKPLMVLNTGDLVRAGDEAKQWANWMRASDPGLGLAAHLPTLGNHDDGPGDGDTAHYNMLFHLPRNDVSGTEDYYYVTLGNMIVVSLSTMTFKGGTRPFADQAAWLDRVLTENPRLWRVVFFHHPIHTSVAGIFGWDLSHPPDEQDQNTALVPILDKHKVDFVFYGHNHWYERFKPMRGGAVASDPKDGTWYVVTGGAGAMTYGLLNAIKLFCPSADGSAVCAGDHHFVDLKVEGNTITYTARATATQLLTTDPGNQKVLDQFVVTKPWPEDLEDPCAEVPIEPEPMPDAAAPDAAITPDVPPPQDPGAPADPGAPPQDPGVAVDRGPADEGAPNDPGIPGDPGVAADHGTPQPPSGKSGGGCAAGGGLPGPGAWAPILPFLLALAARRGRSRS